MVKVLKPFGFGGKIVHPGEEIETTVAHAKELARNGLTEGEGVDPVEAEEPAAEEPAITSQPKPSRRKKIIGKK